MKLSITAHDTTYTIDIKGDGIDMEELYENLKQLCLCAGYHPGTVNEYFCPEEIENKELKDKPEEK